MSRRRKPEPAASEARSGLGPLVAIAAVFAVASTDSGPVVDGGAVAGWLGERAVEVLEVSNNAQGLGQ